jgi:hypothetical protein
MQVRKEQLDASMISSSLIFTGYFVVVCGGLYLGHGWGWWAAFIGLFAPAAIIAMKSVVFFDAMGGVTILFLFQAFLATHPWLERLSPDITNDIDAIAKSLGLRWEDQPLWQMVKQADAGDASKVVKQYRDMHAVSWDEADHAIKRWYGNEEGLKAYLLRQHVEKIHEDGNNRIGKQN